MKIEPGLLADESTDFNITKAICIMVRYPDPYKERIVDSLRTMIREDDGDVYSKADAKTIALKIEKSLAEEGLTIDDFDFSCSDKAPFFRGIFNSVIQDSGFYKKTARF
ncbi:hypothetical protein QAD02_020711 [Eretmocerus hayati]|uniref:Uncharacterized protein n=1 Tax=Eretmocerus hayati TaxID=131215 RepID=A0ACC2PP72_9HYME|nr:hypothetical protein QAD02_020711 [Eretmocerus hayati]